MAIKINKYPDWKHFEERKSPLIKYLIVHSFALSVTEMISVLDQYKLAVHYIIDTKGQIIQLLPEDKLFSVFSSAYVSIAYNHYDFLSDNYSIRKSVFLSSY